jgi:hypothetical protein
MEPAVGIEPTTGGLRNRCSTSELRWRVIAGVACDDARLTLLDLRSSHGGSEHVIERGPGARLLAPIIAHALGMHLYG